MYLYRDYDHCIGHVKSWCFVSVSSWLQQCNTWAQFLFIIVIPPRLPATSVIKLPCSGPSQPSVLHLALGSFTSRNIARYWLIIAIFAYPTCFRRPVGGRGSRLLFGVEKLEWFGYPTEKKNWRYVSRAKKRYQVLEIEILAVPDTLEFSASNKANRLLIALLLPEKMSTKLFQIVPHHA